MIRVLKKLIVIFSTIFLMHFTAYCLWMVVAEGGP